MAEEGERNSLCCQIFLAFGRMVIPKLAQSLLGVHWVPFILKKTLGKKQPQTYKRIY